jgi:hypothetical protein
MDGLLIFTKASKAFENEFKKPQNLSKRPTIILKILKVLHHFKKASILLKMSSKSIVILKNASDFLLKPPFL